MPRYAFLTLEDRAGFHIDDAHAISALEARGAAVDEIPWKEALDRDLSIYTQVIVRTTWDYTRELARFLDTLTELDRRGVPLANDVALIRWNADKHYLRDLAARGIRIVPSQFGPMLDRRRLDELAMDVETSGFREWIVKPTVSANANDTFRLSTSLSSGEAEAVLAVFRHRAWIAQPFLESVVREGEFSVHYFGGRYSHTILKTPKRGDFRVQEEHGGYVRQVEPPPVLRGTADRAMHLLGEQSRALGAPSDMPLQARVDLVRFDDRFVLMELELIEPSLYFRCDPTAAGRFAEVLLGTPPVRRRA